MAVQSETRSAPPPRLKSPTRTSFENPKVLFSAALLLADAVFVFLIIAYVPYTKIDWEAYMSQISGFLGGERDYRNLKGDTGPLVYPAGFLYIYSAFQYVTGGEVYPAQILFGILYIINLTVVLFIHLNTDVLPCGAVSVKMNVLLYAPPLLLLLLKAMDFGVVLALVGAALIQILLGLPFLVSHPVAYISRAFNLGRVFIHYWSVNFKFIPEQVFVSKGLAIFLLLAHLILLASFAHHRWCKHEGGLLSFLHSRYVSMKLRYCDRNVRWKFHWHYMCPFVALSILFVVLLYNTLPVVENSLPNIASSCVGMSILLNSFSSALLLCLHLIILWGLWSAPSEYPYANDKSSANKDK